MIPKNSNAFQYSPLNFQKVLTVYRQMTLLKINRFIIVSPKYPIWSPCLLHGFHPAVVSCCNKILPVQAIDTFAAVWLLHFLFLKNVTSAILFLNWLNLILWTSWFFSSARTKSNDEIMEFGKSSDVGDFDALMPIELNNWTEIRFTLDHVFTYLPTVGF